MEAFKSHGLVNKVVERIPPKQLSVSKFFPFLLSIFLHCLCQKNIRLEGKIASTIFGKL